MKFQRRALAAFVLILISAGCDQVQRADITAPAFAANKKQTAFVQRVNALTTGQTQCAWVAPGQTATVAIGANTLEIPRKASSGPATYCMTIKPGSEIAVELRAWDNAGIALHEFRATVRLTLSYADASEAPTGLRIMYVVNGEVVEVLGTGQDFNNKTVTSSLRHFSDYIIGFGPLE